MEKKKEKYTRNASRGLITSRKTRNDFYIISVVGDGVSSLSLFPLLSTAVSLLTEFTRRLFDKHSFELYIIYSQGLGETRKIESSL